MQQSRPIVAVYYYFGEDELNNRIFDPQRRDPKARGMQRFRAFMAARGAEVVTVDTIRPDDPNVKNVLYFDYNWRMIRSDPYLLHFPQQKRALIVIEPANVNPSLYYTSLLRRRFETVFTWDLGLLKRNPSYARINVPVGAEPGAYRENPFRGFAFADKRLLVAVSMNRWSYMPQSTYAIRKKAYRFFERAYPARFDLYGVGWNAPCVFYEKWFGCPQFASWRGAIDSSFDAKVRKIASYRFALCFENNASEPGYVSEKITDCFCARCVPVYYGSEGTDQLIPRDAWIDLRDFRDFAELGRFLAGMNEAEHRRYLEAIDRFMLSDRLDFFSTDHLFGVVADRLGFPVSDVRP